MNKRGILKIKAVELDTSAHLIPVVYASKLFRNDSKALELDTSAHLIPAPYDPTLLISR